ncbi:NAD(P)-dependent oxidoreductase [Afipia sp. GAS231]|uniref:NAD-dependent epimerase/dehydratase family protein n=1 Tax=Afipia sp. GAS231 TaxID=1882747 RepID=UPI00087BE6D9|nr:NAD-dependent epimerase/dehydratase family protein [Afipia sp. GAS231]SDN36312.1 UDP-glucose 4-epimerase [Afipia sp. GAS231]
MQDRRILVTGGVGYVGRELVHQLVTAGDGEIHVLDSLACGEQRLDFMDRDKFVLHRCDVRDDEAVSAVMKKVAPEIIHHLAAIHFIPTCEAHPGSSNSINVSGTVNLLNAAPPKARFVLASTAAVYRPFSGEHVELDEALGPVDIYGHTKLHAEHFVRYFHDQNRIRGVIVRLFNVVGPGETNPHLVPAIIGQLARGKTSISLGNLFPHRDYIDVQDVARGFRALADHAAFDGGPVISNLGTGVTHAVGDVVRLIAEAAGVKLDILQDPARVRAVDRPMLRASTEKLKQITNWAPAMTLDQSMRRAWNSRVQDGFA